MANRGKILVAHDLSCRGNASLGIVIPVLTSAGYEVVALPTVLLSSTTDIDSCPASLSTTNWMRQTIDKFKSQNVNFVAIYTGWLGDAKQVDILVDLCNWQKKINPRVKIFVDPVMGDGGKLYPCQAAIAKQMPKLVKLADVAFPNPTEAALLLDDTCHIASDGSVSITMALTLASMLASKFRNVAFVITSVSDGKKIGAYLWADNFYRASIMAEKIPSATTIGGTGDLFASLVIARFAGEDFYSTGIHQCVSSAVSKVAEVLAASSSGCLEFRGMLNSESSFV